MSREEEPQFLKLIRDDTTAEVVTMLMEEIELEETERDNIIKNTLNDEEIYQKYLEWKKGDVQEENEIFLEELTTIMRRMVENLLEKGEWTKTEVLLRSSGVSDMAIESFQRWKRRKKVTNEGQMSRKEEKQEEKKEDRETVRILVIGERQMDVYYVVNSIINYLQFKTLPKKKKVVDIQDFCECDNWHYYVMESKRRDVHIVPLHEDFLQLEKFPRIAQYFIDKSFNGVVLAAGLDVGSLEFPTTIINCFKSIFGTFSEDKCLIFSESSFAIEQNKTPDRFWFTTGTLTNCRGLRICATEAKKTYLFLLNEWEQDAQEMTRLFKVIEGLPLQSTIISTVDHAVSPDELNPFIGEVKIEID